MLLLLKKSHYAKYTDNVQMLDLQAIGNQLQNGNEKIYS
jgi:hypothetical protein